MNVQIVTREARTLAYIRVIGPYETALPSGFDQLCRWAEQQGKLDGEWYALYWDNPELTAPEALTTDVAITVAEDYPGDELVAIQTLPAGRYACYSCRIEDDDFATPWIQFFKQWLPQSGEVLGEGACFEQYLNDGHKDGYWDMRLFIPLR